jgi:hypothetical protein
MRAFHLAVPALASVVLGACAAALGVSRGPVPEPRPGILGCVESRELADYVHALDAHRAEARRASLTALGATAEDRRGVFGAAGAAALDQSYEADGKRFAVAAQLAPHFEPRAALAKQGPVLRRIDERPRAHPVDVLVCGLERCARPRSGQRVEALPLVVELGPGERWGGALELAYDYWWARVRYDRRETCPPPRQAD